MDLMTEHTNLPDHERPSDDDLARRTQMLLAAAENISHELSIQTERLASTIDIFNREVVNPLRRLTKEEHDKENRNV